MHKFKINLQSALSKSEVGKTSPDWIKIDKHYRHTAIVIVSAMKLIREQKIENEKYTAHTIISPKLRSKIQSHISFSS